MKREAIGWTLLGPFFAFPSAYADESSKAFNGKRIDTEIQHRRIKAVRVESRSERIRGDAEKAKEQIYRVQEGRKIPTKTGDPPMDEAGSLCYQGRHSMILNPALLT